MKSYWWLLLLPFPVAAEPMAPLQSVGSVIISLLFVIGLIMALAYLAKRFKLPMAGQGAIQVVASMPLSPKERLLVVQVGQQQYLLSSGAAGTRLIDTLSEPLELPTPVVFGSMLQRYKEQQEK